MVRAYSYIRPAAIRRKKEGCYKGNMSITYSLTKTEKNNIYPDHLKHKVILLYLVGGEPIGSHPPSHGDNKNYLSFTLKV